MRLNEIKCQSCHAAQQPPSTPTLNSVNGETDESESLNDTNNTANNNSTSEQSPSHNDKNSSSSAIAKCEECNKYLCVKCVLEHQLNASYSNHQLIKISNVNMEQNGSANSNSNTDLNTANDELKKSYSSSKLQEFLNGMSTTGLFNNSLSANQIDNSMLLNNLANSNFNSSASLDDMYMLANSAAMNQSSSAAAQLKKRQIEYEQQQLQMRLELNEKMLIGNKNMGYFQQQQQNQQNSNFFILNQHQQQLQKQRLSQIESDIQKTYNFYLHTLKERKDYLIKELNTIVQYALINHGNSSKQLQLLKQNNGMGLMDDLFDLNNNSTNGGNNPLTAIEFVSNYSAIQTSVRNTFGYIRINQNNMNNKQYNPNGNMHPSFTPTNQQLTVLCDLKPSLNSGPSTSNTNLFSNNSQSSMMSSSSAYSSNSCETNSSNNYIASILNNQQQARLMQQQASINNLSPSLSGGANNNSPIPFNSINTTPTHTHDSSKSATGAALSASSTSSSSGSSSSQSHTDFLIEQFVSNLSGTGANANGISQLFSGNTSDDKTMSNMNTSGNTKELLSLMNSIVANGGANASSTWSSIVASNSVVKPDDLAIFSPQQQNNSSISATTAAAAAVHQSLVNNVHSPLVDDFLTKKSKIDTLTSMSASSNSSASSNLSATSSSSSTGGGPSSKLINKINDYQNSIENENSDNSQKNDYQNEDLDINDLNLNISLNSSDTVGNNMMGGKHQSQPNDPQQILATRSILKRAKMIYHCKFGEFGVSDGQFTEPSGVTININNDIIVADTNSHRIQIFDKEGRFKFKFGECGKRDGQLLYPNRVAIVKQTGDIVVTERSPTHQIQIYNKYGQFLRKFGANILQHPRGVCVDSKCRIIVVECKVMRVIIFDLMGNILNKFNCSKYLEFPNGVCCSNDREEIFISDNRAHCIKVFNYEGVFIRQIGGEGITNYPIGVGINTNGEILVADNHNNFNLTVFTQDGQLINALESKVKHAQCFDVGLMDDGSIVLASKDYRIYVYKYVNTNTFNPSNAFMIAHCSGLPASTSSGAVAAIAAPPNALVPSSSASNFSNYLIGGGAGQSAFSSSNIDISNYLMFGSGSINDEFNENDALLIGSNVRSTNGETNESDNQNIVSPSSVSNSAVSPIISNIF